MTDSEKLTMLKVFLDITDTSEDNTLSVYLSAAQREIISWHFGNNTTQTSVPTEYEMTQLQAVVAGYNLKGAENEETHNENGINRKFKYSDMIDDIRANVTGYAKVL